jgi:hypothetical protein
MEVLAERVTTLTLDAAEGPQKITTGVSGETLVTLISGSSKRIANIDTPVNLWGWSGTGLEHTSQLPSFSLGKRRCVRLVLGDGRSVICTPDQRFLVSTASGAYLWRKADELTSGSDRLVCGMEGTEDVIGNDEAGWSLTVGGVVFTMKPEQREATLAFARVLGYLLTDGSISVSEVEHKMSISMGHDLDVEAILQDVEMLAGKRPTFRLQETDRGTVYSFFVPRSLSYLYLALDGIEVGRRSTIGESGWPRFLLEQNCPLAVVREFIGGIMGGDGFAPSVINTEGATKSDPFSLRSRGIIALSSLPENIGTLRRKLEDLCGLLGRLGLVGCTISGSPDFYYTKKKNPTDENLRAKLTIFQYGEGDTTHQRAFGFRCCIQKQLRATAAQTLWRFLEEIRKQRAIAVASAAWFRQTYNLSYPSAMEAGINHFLTTAVVIHPPAIQCLKEHNVRLYMRNGPCEDKQVKRLGDIPLTRSWFEGIGAGAWFKNKDKGHTGYHAPYIVPRKQEFVPVLTLPVLGREEAGEHEVYSLPSNKLDSSVYNGVVAYTGRETNSGDIPALISLLLPPSGAVSTGQSSLTLDIIRD